MHRKFIAIIIAAAVSVTAIGSAPARADENVLRALAAIAGLAIVGKVIHDRNERKSAGDTVTRQVLTPQAYNRATRTYDLAPRPLPARASRRLLPGDCLRSAQTRDGRVRYFGQRCLRRKYDHADRLPQNCAVRFRGEDRIRKGFEARCLRDEGYQLARR